MHGESCRGPGMLSQESKHLVAACTGSTVHPRLPVQGNYPCVQVLLEHNASPDVRNCAGLVPLSRLALLLAAGLEVDERAFELLLRSMGPVEVRDHEGRLPPLLARDKRMRTRLLALCTTPRPLAQLGRSAVRRCLGPCHLPSAVSALPVPERLQRFLLLEEAA